MGGLGESPAVVAEPESEVEQSAQVDRGGAVVEPVVVLGHASVGHFPVAADQPGDGAFDHRPVLPVGGLEAIVGGALAVLALQHVLGMQRDLAAPFRGGALLGQGAPVVAIEW